MLRETVVKRSPIQALSDFVRFRKGLHQDSSLAQTLNAPSGGNRTEILASCIEQQKMINSGLLNPRIPAFCSLAKATYQSYSACIYNGIEFVGCYRSYSAVGPIRGERKEGGGV